MQRAQRVRRDLRELEGTRVPRERRAQYPDLQVHLEFRGYRVPQALRPMWKDRLDPQDPRGRERREQLEHREHREHREHLEHLEHLEQREHRGHRGHREHLEKTGREAEGL